MIRISWQQRATWSVLLVLAWIGFQVVDVVNGLSSSLKDQAVKRPIVSLTGEGDVSGFLYGKLQRATSIYGSGLIGPATAVVHGSKDTSELLPPRISKIATPQRQLKDLETMLWNQFGMATCEGSVEREDLLTSMSYLKPRLCELNHTLVFLDATTKSINGKSKSNSGSGEGGIGGLFSSIFSNNKDPRQQNQQQPAPEASETKDCWLDTDLVRSAVTRGASVFVVCESQDTEDCVKQLGELMVSLGENGNAKNSIATLISPDDHVKLGGPEDGKWNSLRPQDLEGELSQTISVRDGTADYTEPEPKETNEEDSTATNDETTVAAPSFKRTREERLAAAYSEDVVPQQNPKKSDLAKGSEARMAHASADYKPPSSIALKDSKLSRNDLAEVSVQCALRLSSAHAENSSSNPIRVVRVTPIDVEEDDDSHGTERPNRDYFTLTGGPKAKARAGVVTSVDWAKTLSCFVTIGGDVSSSSPSGGSNSNLFGGVKEFPKRPDVKS